MPEPGEIISGKYRILECLGSGAMGIVYSARHLDTDKQVALKWLNPTMSRLHDGQERFKREAKATGRIHHPNVVAVHDCGDHEGQLYLVMEYLAGPTLRAKLTTANEKRFSLTEALDLLFPVMRGIAAAHAAGVLHRDLKPENVLLSESPDGLAPIPKVLDFGLAKVRSEAASFAAKLSMPGSVLGTYQYMAPEQLRPQVEVDERIDVYALGAMLYEMLSGRPPYHADNPVDLVLQIHAGEAPPLDELVPNLPVDLSAVLARALARDREQRFASVDAFALALEPFTVLSFRGERRELSARALAITEAAIVTKQRPRPGLPRSQSRHDRRTDAATLAERRSRLALPRIPLQRERWLGVGLGLLALFAQPTAGLAVADSSSQRGAASTPQPSAAGTSASLAATPSAPSATGTQATKITREATLPAQPAQESDWLDPASDAPPPTAAAQAEGVTPTSYPRVAMPTPSRALDAAAQALQPRAAAPAKEEASTRAARSSAPLPTSPRSESRPLPPAARSTPSHPAGAGPLGVNEF